MRAVLMAAIVAGVAQASSIDVGSYEPTDPTSAEPKLPGAGYGIITHETDLTLSGSDTLGVADGNGGIVTQFGLQTYNYAGTPPSISKEGIISNNYQVNGTLSITEQAQVALGGQYKVKNSSYLVHQLATGNYDEYTGIIANTIVVDSTRSDFALQSSNATVNTLHVKEGIVNLHTQEESGNSSLIQFAPRDSKQVQIRQSLVVEDGAQVTIGKHSDYSTTQDDIHCVVGFGELELKDWEEKLVYGIPISVPTDYEITSATLTQTGGELTVAGKSVSAGGLNIEQSGGSMSVSADSYHVLADYNNATITQSGDNSEMVVGKIIADNLYYDKVVMVFEYAQRETPDINPALHLTQEGNGSIKLQGVDFTNYKEGDKDSAEVSTITQTGDGTITLDGEYVGASFEIKQSGAGTVALSEGASMTVNNLMLNTNAALTLAADATLTVAQGSNITIALNSMKDADGALQLADAADLEVFATTITLDLADVSLGELAAVATEAGTLVSYTLMTGGEAWSTMLTDGTLTLENAGTSITLDYQGTELLIQQVGLAEKDGALVAELKVSGKSIPEPATATLSLLALAALAARRRR